MVLNTTPFFSVVQIIYFHDCLRIYTFIFLTPWQGLENGSFRILADKRVVLPYSRTFTKIFIFSLENPSFGMLTISKIGRFDFTQKMARKFKIFTLSHRKVIVLEIELKIMDIWTTLPPEIHQINFSDNHGNKLLDKRQNLRESSIS